MINIKNNDISLKLTIRDIILEPPRPASLLENPFGKFPIEYDKDSV